MLKNILYITIIVLASIYVFFTGYVKKTDYFPEEIYQVYLEGQKIGLIDSKEDLQEYINKQEKNIKETYNAEEVYLPEGLEIEKVITYSGEISSAKEIYEEIKAKNSFSIKGYKAELTLDDENKTIYVLENSIIEEAIDITINAFVKEDRYNSYKNENQEAIETTGSIIEDIKISQDIKISENLISINETIYKSAEELAKFMLYGTTDEQKTYVVKPEENISQIAFDHKLSAEEFLVANPNFNSADVLLTAGQEVKIGLIDPQIDVVEELYLVDDEPKKFSTEIVYDETILKGINEVTQEGEDGLNRVTKRLTKVNGVILKVEILNTEELKPAVNKVIVKGAKYVPNVGTLDYWYWPTEVPYVITSTFGYRWGKLHAGIDVAGCGYDSDLYSANNGTVIKTSYDGDGYGRYVVVDHNNGYYTLYAHMSRIDVKVGQDVKGGQVLGGMGNSGFVVGRTGIHLHFEIWIGRPHAGGYRVNPLRYY